MKNKHFIPSIEDIRVGYELEHKTKSEWQTRVLNRTSEVAGIYWEFTQARMDGLHIRVPYLTKEALTEELKSRGWTPTFDFNRMIMGEFAFNKPEKYSSFGPFRTVIVYHDGTRSLKIYNETLGRRIYIRYSGQCDDINSFRNILKLLKQ